MSDNQTKAEFKNCLKRRPTNNGKCLFEVTIPIESVRSLGLEKGDELIVTIQKTGKNKDNK